MKKIKELAQSGFLFIVIAAFLWSFDGILRVSLYTVAPEVIVFYEHLLGAVLLFAFFFKTIYQDFFKMTKREWKAMTIVALFSGALGTIFYTAALGMVNYIQFSVVVLLQQLQPIWAILGAAIILKERITKDFTKWAILALIASYFVTFKDLTLSITPGNPTLIAAVLALLAGVVWGVSTSYSKVVLQKVSYLSATAFRFTLAPVFALLFVFVRGNAGQLTTLTQSQWLTLLTITLTTGMVALVIYYYGLRKVPARVSSIAELTWPMSAIFIDFFYFKNALTLTQLGGVLVLLFAMSKVSRYKK